MEEYSNMWKHCNLLLRTQLVLKTLNLKIEKNILNLKTEKKKLKLKIMVPFAFHAVGQ